ncbi:MAG: 4-alpha-glucanotransferase [Eubacterium sp.]|nr:4-alpha-glucanotransferase [Eubacterium sp.]
MRKSGILLHISSLPSPYGIGTLGKEAYKFTDFLEEAGQSFWQMLPICPTSYGDSPYQTFSTFAGNPYFIDFDLLKEKKLLKKSDYSSLDFGKKEDSVDYGALYENRFKVLRIAAENFLKTDQKDFKKFCKKNSFWLDDYALFMTLKFMHAGASFYEWERRYRIRESKALSTLKKEKAFEIYFWKFVQFEFFSQWFALKKYANSKNVEIIGDIPIYVALDSADVWAGPKLFQLKKDLKPKRVAGCPPDGFSEDGQLWGNPLYEWDYHKSTDYEWWIKRISYMCDIYDVLRIDHFRGFDAYYSISAKNETAKGGKWVKGPGIELFNTLEKKIGKKRIIAEDLGFLTPSVKKMLKESGFPGMKVMEFAFDSRDNAENDYLPHNYINNCVAYLGTHDNDTIIGWMKTAAKTDVNNAKEYLSLNDKDNYNWDFMKALWATVADTTIVQIQDVLGLGSKARMNIPSTTEGNWQFRLKKGDLNHSLAKKLKTYMLMYGR